jgi:hypothetical protein
VPLRVLVFKKRRVDVRLTLAIRCAAGKLRPRATPIAMTFHSRTGFNAKISCRRTSRQDSRRNKNRIALVNYAAECCVLMFDKIAD